MNRSSRDRVAPSAGWVVLLAALGCQAPGISTTSGSPDPTSRPRVGDPDGAGGAPGPVLNLPDAGPAIEPPVQTCAQEVHTAQKEQVDLLLLVDASDSMVRMSGAQTKWERLRAALATFVKDPAS